MDLQKMKQSLNKVKPMIEMDDDESSEEDDDEIASLSSYRFKPRAYSYSGSINNYQQHLQEEDDKIKIFHYAQTHLRSGLVEETAGLGIVGRKFTPCDKVRKCLT